MKGILRIQLDLLQFDWNEVENDSIEYVNPDDVFSFTNGEEVEVLKIIEDASYLGGTAFVILNEENESITVSSALVDLVD